jgi:hypothetical protein
MRLSLLAVLATASVAYAGVNGTTVLNYSIQNNTGATATDLHVDTGDIIDSASSPDFSNVTIGTSSAVQFSNGDVGTGLSATLTLGSDAGLSYITADPQGVVDYCWANPGADSTCASAPSATTYDPLYFSFALDIFSGEFDLDLSTSSSTALDYTNLAVTQDGQNLLLGTVGTSGSVSSTGLQVTGDLNLENGPIDFAVDDVTDGLTINGSFTTAPEPATTAVCALMLLAMIVAVRRRAARTLPLRDADHC